MSTKRKFSKHTTIATKPGLYPEEAEFLLSLMLGADSFVLSPSESINARGNVDMEDIEKLRILSISFKMPNPEKYIDDAPIKKIEKEYKKNPYKVVNFKDRTAHLKRQDIKNIIEEVLEKHHTESNPINFLVLNELALSYESEAELEEEIITILNKTKPHKALVSILGTYHCQETSFNACPIIGPVVGGKLKYDRVGYAVKQTSAMRCKESIRTPDTKSYRKINTPYGKMVVWVCLDMYDPALVLKMIRSNNRLAITGDDRQDVVDIIVIPSYNSDNEPRVSELACMISKYGRTTVILCNDSQERPNGWNNSIGYYYGRKIEPYDVSRELNETDQEKCNVKLFEIDWKSRYEEQSRPYDKEYSSLFSQIIGIQSSAFTRVG